VRALARGAARVSPADAFLRACELDVQVRKPGNVSLDSPGHGMQAAQFIDAARAAAGPLFTPGERVGRRIEGAVAASLAAAGCNTNLGIVLLAAPVAAACEQPGALDSPAALRDALRRVLRGLDRDDARAAFAAIAAARPGGLGRVAREDVRDEPQGTLGQVMALAAGRDSIARQYAQGFADLFDTGLPLCAQGVCPAAVQRVFLGFLARWPDSHIVRKHGEAVAQTVMSAAQGLAARGGAEVDAAALAGWDQSLKAQGLNPGTSADLTVATLMLALLWHGS
jgi:triphosphoribosyl-dephospho-CoA synthase